MKICLTVKIVGVAREEKKRGGDSQIIYSPGGIPDAGACPTIRIPFHSGPGCSKGG